MRRVANTLARCLEDVEDGRASSEECMARHPDLRSEMAPLLAVVRQIPPAPQEAPSPEFRARARAIINAEIAGAGPANPSTTALAPSRRAAHRFRFSAATAVTAMALAVAALAGGAGMSAAAQTALPGDFLYPVKQTKEAVRLATLQDPASRAAYQRELALRRIQEVRALAEAGRPIGPESVEAISASVDASLAEVRQLPALEAQAALGALSAALGEERSALEETSREAASEAQAPLAQAGVVAQRGWLVTQALAEDPARLESSPSIREARDGEVRGPVTSVDPLRIAGVRVILPPGARVEGILSEGVLAHARGVMQDDGAIRAARVEVEQGAGAGPASLRGVIADTDPLTIDGRQVTVDGATAVEGMLLRGLMAEVTGRFLEDGSILALTIRTEHPGNETELRDVVTALQPLTVGKIVIEMAPGAGIEGIPQVGASARMKGWPLGDARFLASEVRVESLPEPPARQQARGTVLSHADWLLTIRTEDGGHLTLRMTERTEVRVSGGGAAPAGPLSGREVRVEFDLASRDAARVTVEARGTGGARETPTSPTTPTVSTAPPTHESRQERAEGVVAAVQGREVTVRTRDGRRVTFQVTEATRVKVKGSGAGSLADVREGRDIRARFDATNLLALELEVER